MKRLFLTMAILALAIPASGADVTLQWDAPDDPRVTGYTVYHGTDNPPAMPIPTTETSLRITGLTEGQTYYFGVKSTDGTRESVMSDVIEWTVTPASQVIQIPGKPREIRLLFD